MFLPSQCNLLLKQQIPQQLRLWNRHFNAAAIMISVEHRWVFIYTRCPADVIIPSMTLLNAVRAPWNFRQHLNFTGHRTVSKNYKKKSYDSSCRRPGAVRAPQNRTIFGEKDAVRCMLMIFDHSMSKQIYRTNTQFRVKGAIPGFAEYFPGFFCRLLVTCYLTCLKLISYSCTHTIQT